MATATTACCAQHDDPTHHHGPSGADLVRDLQRGMAILTLVLPALAIIVGCALLPFTPSTPLPVLLGIALGAAQLLALMLISIASGRSRAGLLVHPLTLAARCLLDEGLRVGVVLLALHWWAAEPRGPLGLWIGYGAALVWIGIATMQSASIRQRLRTPSSWGREAIATLLDSHVRARHAIAIRVIDVLATVIFQLGATVLVIASPVMAVATGILAMASGLATLMLHNRSGQERLSSMWTYTPLAVSVLTFALAITVTLA